MLSINWLVCIAEHEVDLTLRVDTASQLVTVEMVC